MRIVFAVASHLVTNSYGGGVHVEIGSHWLPDDPLVLANPWLFTADPRWGLNHSIPLEDIPSYLADSPPEPATATVAAAVPIRRGPGRPPRIAREGSGT